MVYRVHFTMGGIRQNVYLIFVTKKLSHAYYFLLKRADGLNHSLNIRQYTSPLETIVNFVQKFDYQY
jgi:hypothetical protein